MDQFDPRLAAQKFAAMEAAQGGTFGAGMPAMAAGAARAFERSRNQAPGMGSMANAYSTPAGMPGTPGGPVEESPTMEWMRALQNTLGGAMMLAPTAAGFYAGAPVGPIGSAVGTMIGSKIGDLGGGPVHQNSQDPNIRDVWADKLRMMLQGN